ncbi:MAG: hypothetical protein KA436_09555 [Oligoflexales bacterium]|nr:hypothetical protein [Oligoflexales bacterium]
MSPLKSILFCSYFFLGMASFLPLEEQHSGFFWLIFFMVKCSLLLPGLLLLLWGHGLALCSWTKASEDKADSLSILSEMLLGLVLVGLEVFILGLFIHPKISAWFPFFAGFGFLIFFQNQLQKRLIQVRLGFFDFWKDFSPYQKISIFLIGALWSLRLLQLFDFQNHEDAYLYHLSLSEIWLYLGKTGFTLSNVCSGYAWIMEHFFLLIKTLVGGNAEQNALAQISHAFLGFGAFFLLIMKILRPYGRTAQIMGSILFLQPHFLAFLTLPKNDGIQLGGLALAFYGLFREKPKYFLIGAVVAPAAKVSAAASLAIITIYFLVKKIRNKAKFFPLCKLLFQGTLLSLLSISPFLIHNTYMTGNPLFPIANNFFKSKFGPQSFASITDRSPFTAQFSDIGQTSLFLLKFFPFIYVGLLASILIRFFRKESPKKLDSSFYQLGLFGLISLSILLGPIAQALDGRFFLLFISLLLCASLIFLISSIKDLPKEKFWLTLFSLLLLSQSQSEVLLSKAKEFFLKPQLTADFFERKPLIAINHELSSLAPFDQKKILTISETNTSYFLKKSTFLHPSFSYPFLLKPWVDLDDEEKKKLIEDLKPDFLILHKSQKESLSRYFRSDKVVLKKDPFIVLDTQN